MNQKLAPIGGPMLGVSSNSNEAPKSPQQRLEPLNPLQVSPMESRNNSQEKPPSSLNKYKNDVLLGNSRAPTNLAPLEGHNQNLVSLTNEEHGLPQKKKTLPPPKPLNQDPNWSIMNNMEENQSLYEQSTHLDDTKVESQKQTKGNTSQEVSSSQVVQFQTQEDEEVAKNTKIDKPDQIPKVLGLEDNNEIKETVVGKTKQKIKSQEDIIPAQLSGNENIAYSQVLTNSGINIYSCNNPQHSQKLAQNVYILYDPNKEQNNFKLGCTHCSDTYGGSNAKYQDFPEIVATLKQEIEKATSGSSKEYRIEDPFKDAKKCIVKKIHSLIKECNFLSKYFDTKAKYLQSVLEQRDANQKLAEAKLKEQMSKPDARALKIIKIIQEFKNLNNLHDQQQYIEEVGKNFIYSNKNNKLTYKTKANSDDIDDENLPKQQRKTVKDCLELSQSIENFINQIPEADLQKLEKRNADLEIQFAGLLALDPAPSVPSTPGHSRQNSTGSSKKDPFLSVLKKSRFKLSEDDIYFIKNSIGPDYEGISLIFRASRDGFDNFHEFCDQKGPTLILISGQRNSQLMGSTGDDEDLQNDINDNLSKFSQSSSEDRSKFMGAFTPLEWKCDGEYQVDDEQKTFLFTFGTPDRYKLQLREERFAIRGFDEKSGMLFGFGSGYDLAIAKETDFYKNSTNLGKSYKLPIIDGKTLSYGSTQAHNFLFGGNNFVVQNYEVYEVY